MSASGKSGSRFVFGVVAILASTLIAALVATGIAHPHPSEGGAYFICVVVAVAGLIQLINAAIERLDQSG